MIKLNMKKKMEEKRGESRFLKIINSKPFMGISIFIILGLVMAFASDVTFKEGSMNVTGNVSVENGFFSKGVTNPVAGVQINRGNFNGFSIGTAPQLAGAFFSRQDTTNANTVGLYAGAQHGGTTSTSDVVEGFNSFAVWTSTGSSTVGWSGKPGVSGGRYLVRMNSDGAITSSSGVSGGIEISSPKVGNITHAASFKALGAIPRTGKIDNAYGFYSEAHNAPTTGSLLNASGIWVEKQTAGSQRNYGIVLDGNGLGADLVLGDLQQSRIYFDGANLIVDSNSTGADGTTAGITWFSANISAFNVIDRSWYWDKRLGSSLNYIKDSDELKTNGEFDDTKLNDFEQAVYKVVDYSRPEIESYEVEICEPEVINGESVGDDICRTETKQRTIYPYTKEETGRSISVVAGKHEQAIYELLKKIEDLEARIALLESKQ